MGAAPPAGLAPTGCGTPGVDAHNFGVSPPPAVDQASFSGGPVHGIQFGQVLNPHSMLDARLVSKPQVFSGREDDWPIWSLSMRSFAGGIHPQMLLLMQEAEARKDQEIPESEVGPTQKALYNQLYTTSYNNFVPTRRPMT